ncbi:MAG TPA: acyl-CoA dehydrogenase family protein [Caulobacter sp.]|nr:acyl-CoA dehydrogenase family protein [Caulobacter sp.]
MTQTVSPATTWRDDLAAIGPRLEAAGAACDREGRFVADNLDLLQARGFFALAVPGELGGGGLLADELCDMLRSLARHCGSSALALAMHTHQVAVAAWRWRHQNAPTEGMLRKVAEGARMVSSGASDWLPGGGVAEKVDGGFRITARKPFASGSPAGTLLGTSAVYDDPEAGPTVLHFALPLSAEGVSIAQTWDSLGMRGTGSHDVVVDGAFIPEAAVTGRRVPGPWHPLFHIISMLAFPLIFSAYAGVADAARDIAIKAAAKKSDDTLTVLAAGELSAAHAGLDALWTALVATTRLQPGEATTDQVMKLRGLVGRAAIQVGELALECAGGAGFYRKAGLELRFRDLQGARFHPLRQREQQLYSGRVALGLPVDG